MAFRFFFYIIVIKKKEKYMVNATTVGDPWLKWLSSKRSFWLKKKKVQRLHQIDWCLLNIDYLFINIRKFIYPLHDYTLFLMTKNAKMTTLYSKKKWKHNALPIAIAVAEALNIMSHHCIFQKSFPEIQPFLFYLSFSVG